MPDPGTRAVLDAIPLGIMVFDMARHMLFANRAALDSLRGVLEGEVPPFGLEPPLEHLRGLFHLVDPDTERDVLPEHMPLAKALRGETSEAREYLVRRNNSAERLWLEMGGQPVLDEAGVLVRALLTFRTIDERKKRELAAESAEKLHSVIYQENLAGILRVDADGRILDCNDAMVRMLGFRSKRDLMAVHATQLHHDPAERVRILGLLKETQQLSEFEVCLRRDDGSSCWVLLNARLLNAPPGETGGSVVSNVIDITERKTQEETLRRSEERFSAFMRHLPGVAFIKDLAGRYVYYNEASWTNFHKRPEDLVGRTDEEVWPGEVAARFRENDLSVIQTRRAAEFVETVAQTEGKQVWLVYKFPILEDGKVTLVGGVGIDITERTVLEEQLTQAGKMEALGRLAGGVAHDFNNLLTVIGGYGQLALEGVGSAPPERLEKYLRAILDSSRRAAGLTSQLLAFSRRQVVQPQIIDLRELLGGMEQLLQRVIGEHVDLTVKWGSTECLIHADANQMEQAIMNLAVNARDAMPLGGVLRFACERLEGAEGAESAVVLEVSDTGVGMEEAEKKRIFDPFYTSKAQGRGTGLGLSTVYGVVSQARGSIDVESVAGEGTVFRLYFPAAVRPETVPPDENGTGEAETECAEPSEPRGGETVLLVEDEAGVRALAETILKQLGYVVLVADCGAAAIAIFESSGAGTDVLLTDVIMPQMSGGELAHRLRAKNPHLRVLFMSGYTDDMIASHGALAGETQLIQKPFTAEALRRKLRDILDA